MNCTTVDLDRAEHAVSSTLINDDKQEKYQPKTLQDYNNPRCIYLPLFPTKSFGPNNCLLLANVPVTYLRPLEILRRQHGGNTTDALTLMDNYNYSNVEFSLSEEDAKEMATRLCTSLSIITFNADRLRGICSFLLTLHESFRKHVLEQRNIALKEPTFNSKQMVIALEFYLQIDVDIFYMKTCSFRGAQPRSVIEGLFCGKDEPEARYRMVPCGNLLCGCCHPPNHWKKTEPWLVVDFASSSTHQFVNGYTTYLNCPATCQTSSIIYSMACPCGHYDYVDSTAQTLSDAMTYHREHGNRIIHEQLAGSPVFRGMLRDPDEKEKEMANMMRLYQHSARCPIALRSFLDCNPIYWCFIPQLWHASLTENLQCFREDQEERRRRNEEGEEGQARPSANTTDPQLANVIQISALDNQRVASYLDHVPIPPSAYAFSHRQRQNQRLFFEKFVSLSIEQLPYSSLDLYKVAMIAILPDDSSIVFRYIIETLFNMHGQTKLNMICPIGGDSEQRYRRTYDLEWCLDLYRHRST